MSRTSTPPDETEPGDGPDRSAAAVYGLLSSLIRHAPRDLSLTSMATLTTLDRTGPRRITELAAVEGITQPSVTALVIALERRGLVERCGDATDKRVVLVTLTAAGDEYLRARRRSGVEAFARLIDRLPPGEADALTAAVAALRHLRALDDEQRDPASAP